MCFICRDDIEWEELEWGEMGWIVGRANVPESSQLTVLDVKLLPGQGHDFHRHPEQEEILFLREGRIEQWVREERRNLKPGDTAFIPQDTVHATFVASDAAEPARLLVVLGPSAGETGYVTIDVGSEEPWASLRSQGGA
jgi:quercetin dioxygenase-like cupin family protein